MKCHMLITELATILITDWVLLVEQNEKTKLFLTSIKQDKRTDEVNTVLYLNMNTTGMLELC